MAELKTQANDASVEEFLAALPDERKREDARTLAGIMRRATGAEPRMWGGSIVGFGGYHYVYESGRRGDWFEVGFSPRKAALVLYLMGNQSRLADVFARLGKYTTGKSCVYVKRLADVDLAVLEELIARAVAQLRAAG